MVEFCSNCDAIIIGKKGEDVKCPACGEVQVARDSVILSEKIKKTDDLEVIETDETAKIHPLSSVICPKCGHDRAYFWTKQMRAGDEPETQFFKCEKCSKQWRDYS